jgi:hypothetical protein
LRYGIYDKPKEDGSGEAPAPPEGLSAPSTITIGNIGFVESFFSL